MGIIKQLREEAGLTQIELSNKTGLSLRTIQRLDGSDKTLKGHTLQVLSDVFNLEPSELQNKIQSSKENKGSDDQSIKYMNLAVLGFFGIPFGNIILPFIIWRKKRKSKLVDEAGKKIINIQILWSILLCFLLCLSSFVNLEAATSFPFTLIVLAVAILINIIVVATTARALQRKNLNFLKPPIQFL